MNLFPDEAERQRQFPVCRDKIFFAHAGVWPLPAVVSEAICRYTQQSSEGPQEFDAVLRDILQMRKTCAALIGADADEIALLGPTSLGLSLFANGIPVAGG